jgi:sortase B
MDFRCNFDQVVNHRRAVKNSDNLIIYGHNMTNKTMFGSLRDYPRNPLYYKEHPIVELQSLYKTYYYKIFSIFIVDGTDYDSEYAFDCWNTIDFSGEEEFYEYVNNAKKRNLISNDVDVVYGDPILTLYTCNNMITTEGKLILMCRMIREDEKGNEKVGTENATLNENVLYPGVYYKNHEQTFDISKFVPYGPKNQD